MLPQRREPIAIVGSGCRFPGEASSPAKLWELLRDPRDVLRPIDRFDTSGFYHADGMHHGSSNIKDSYLLSEDHRLFDAQFFNINSVEANSIDPSQRLLLKTVYEALESAGLKLENMRGSSTAVYVGLMCEEYSQVLLRDLDSLPTYFATGTARSIISNRISYFFDWHGPSMTIDTACSSSLVAIHQAVQTLRSGESRTAIAAGANLILGPEAYIAESKLKMLSPGSRSRMWDADADGYARGDGIAAVVLKTLSNAIEDGDHIECIIRETAVNQDGRTKGITMPSAIAQTSLIRECYAKAGLDISKEEDRPQYFEAHGTGTPAGDPIEAEAISRAFFEFQDETPVPEKKLYVGSIKTVIGHTEGTAGIAAVLKASLALQLGVIPPNMLFNQLNPSLQPFYKDLEIVTATNQEWPTVGDGLIRRASVNSFGFGGTNSHIILESYESVSISDSKILGPLTPSIPFIFTAASQRSLLKLLASYSTYLKAHPLTNLRDLAWTLSARRSNLPIKETFPGVSIESLCSKIDAYVELNKGKAEQNPPKAFQTSPRVLGVFTGQGAQWAGMGRELILGSNSVRKTIDDLELSLGQLPVDDRPSWSLKDELLADGKTSRLADATLSQPLCTALQVVLVDLLRSTNVQLDAVVGHSSGEIGAAYAAGYISAKDAIRIAYYRGLHSNLATGKGGMTGAMMAVGTSPEDALELCSLPEFEGRITVAAYNSSESVTLSGDADAINEAQIIFEEEKKFTRVLQVNKAYHSHHMIPCSKKYIESIQACDIHLQTPPHNASAWLSSVSEDSISSNLDDLRDVYWNNNMLKTVLFSPAVEMAVAEKGPFDLAIEIGPHPALKGPVVQTIKDLIGGESIPYCGLLSRGKNDIESFADALGFIWKMTDGNIVDFQSYDRRLINGPSQSLLKNLPTYAWDHERTFWHESRLSKAFLTKPAPVHDLLGTRSPDGTKEELRWRNSLRPREISWLNGHQLQGQTVFPAAGYVVLALEASKALVAGEEIRLIDVQDLQILQATIFNDDDVGVETLVTLTNIQQPTKTSHTASFMFYTAAGKDSNSMTLTATSRVQVVVGEASPNALPARGSSQPNMIEVSADRFYSFLGELGYGYSGPFRALSCTKRKLGMATGLVSRGASDSASEPLMVSPAMLDAAIQSIILAFCYPGDGQLWSLHVPTSIRRVTINPSLCCLNADQERQLIFDSAVADNASGVYGDVDIFTPLGDQCIIQVEGMHAVPFSKATSAQDTQIFSKMIWERAIPNGEAAAYDGRATSEDYELAYILERVALFYLRQIDKTILETEPPRSEGPYVGFFNFATHILTVVSRGKHSYAKKEWINDSQDQIYTLSKKFPENVDLKIMHIVGKYMPAVARGETNILEHLRENDLLDEYYSHAMGISQYTNYLARIAGQITFRYPHMKILEIGSGTGGATKGILKHLNRTYSSYTFTDISNGFFEKAQGLFEEYKDKLIFKALDIEKDIASQGFAPHSYDMIIASFVLHATANLENTLTNVRQLLRPGGYLLMLELTNNNQIRTGFIFGALPGWWLGANDGRLLSPCVSSAEWGKVLRKTGFSGIDTITPDHDSLPYPASVIVSQAIDERISFIRQPLSTKAPTVVELTIIGGTTLKTSRLIDNIVGVLGDHCESISRIDTLETLNLEGISSNSVVLCLEDLDNPIFKAMSSGTFSGLKCLFNQAGSILWVTQGCRTDDPFANMTVGFGRSLLLEMPDVQLQFLDLSPDELPIAEILAESLLRFQAAHSWMPEDPLEALWSVEPEIAFDNGQYLLPRILLDDAKNNRYNSSRRFITDVVDPRKFPTSIGHTGTSHIVVAGENSLSLTSLTPEGFIAVEVQHSMLLSLKFLSTGYLFLVSGKDLKSGKIVVALSQTQTSIVKTPKSWSIDCPAPTEESIVFMLVLFIHLMALSFISAVPAGGVIVVLEPGKFIAPVLAARALEKGIKVVYITSLDQNKEPPWIFIHSHTHQRSIRALLPTSVSLFINILGSQAQEARIIPCLPPNCKLESTDTILGYKSYIDPVSTISISDILALAYKNALTEPFLPNMQKVPIVGLNDIPNPITNFKGPSVVDWSLSNTARIMVEPAMKQPLFSDDKTYWLVGLTGSLGLSLCEWMVRNGARFIVLTSRNPNIEKKWLDTIKATGATIKVFANDVTDKVAVKAMYEQIRNTLPPLAGVAQGAMVLQDTLISDMSIEQMHKVLKPKVDGSKNLNEILSDSKLDFMIFFSSGTCVTGNLGQANYAAANMFMTGLAAQRRKSGLVASVINIGVIIGVGYVTMEVSQAHQDNLRKVGHMWMSEQDFHTMFAEAIISGRPDSGLSPEILTGLRITNSNDDDKTIWFHNPKFQHLITQELADAGKSSAKSRIFTKALLLEATSKDDVYNVLKDSFSFKLQGLLQLNLETIGSIIGLRTDELGIDSLIAVEIRSWFLKELAIDMPVLKILSGASVGDLIEHALKTLPEGLTPNVNPNSEVSGSSNATSVVTPQASEPPLPPSPIFSKCVIEQSAEDSSLDGIEISIDSDLIMIPLSENDDLKSVESPVIIESNDLTFSTTSSSLADSLSRDESCDETASPASVLQRSVRMSFGQSRFYFLMLYLEDPTTFNIFCSMRLTGNLRIGDLENAVTYVGYHHEALRTCFFTDSDQQPRQGVLSSAVLQLEKKSFQDDDGLREDIAAMKAHVFDLEHGQTMRIMLLSDSRKPDTYQLLIAYHHINMDGISLQVLISDLESAYNGLPLSRETIQFPDYSTRQRREHENMNWKSDLDFWKQEFQECPPPLPIFPLSRVTLRQTMSEYSSHKVEARISLPMAKIIVDTCKRLNATPFHFYLAALKALILRFSDAEDFCIGIADANRDQSTAQAIGFYLNLLPLRFTANSAQTFSNAIKDARSKAYSALSHSKIPFDVLLDELKVPRSAKHSPLFQVFLDYRQATKEARSFGNCQLVAQDYEMGRTAYDLTIDVIDNPGGDPLVTLFAQRSLFTKDDGELLMKSYLNLIEAFAQNPALRLNRPPIFSPADLEVALNLGRGPKIVAKWPATLSHRVDTMIERKADCIALRGEDISLTYAQMGNRMHAIATMLQEKKIGKHSRVAIFQEPSTDWICSLLAIFRIGAVYIPLDLQSSIPRLTAIVKDCRPDSILLHTKTAATVHALQANYSVLLDVSEAKLSTSTYVSNDANPESNAVILYTSGSTGVPKGITLRHSSLRNELEGSATIFGINSESVVLQQSALSFDFSMWQIFCAIANGGTLYIAPISSRGDPTVITRLIEHEGITLTGATPSEYLNWLRNGDKTLLKSSSWTTAVSGGEQVTTTIMQAFDALDRNQLRFWNIYGPTETTISSNKIELSYADLSRSTVDQGRIPAGYTTPNCSVYIVDNFLKPVPIGMPGEVLIGGLGVASSYLNNKELTAQKFLPDVFAHDSDEGCTMHRTGDRGRLRTDGALIIEGRIAGDTQIKLRGLRIDLRDIESAIIHSSNGLLSDAVVSVRRTDANGPEFLIAHVVFSPGRKVDNIQKFLRRLPIDLPLPQYMVPARIIALDKMPINIHSKTDRLAVSILPLENFTDSVSDEIELNDTELQLKAIWIEVLSNNGFTDTVDLETDFFHIGGNSLLLVSLQARIRAEFNTSLSLNDLFQASTLDTMAARINANNTVPKAQLIDWKKETEEPIEPFNPHTRPVSGYRKTGKIIVLTGSTGFLGRVILRRLVESETVAKIYCIAVRLSKSRAHQVQSSKIKVFEGDLALPSLGLSENDSQSIFQQADAIIHNGADVSFLKTFHSLRQANLQSTKQLANMAVRYQIAFHYISTSGVAQLARSDSFGEASVAAYPPAIDGSNGYIATKWASERYIENLSEKFALPVWIHRPSSITGDQAPEHDIMQNLLRFSRELKAVPKLKQVKGHLDFIAVELVASGILHDVLLDRKQPASLNVNYRNHSGQLIIPVSEFQESLERESGTTFRSLPLVDWIAEAKERGIDVMVAAYFGLLEDLGGDIVFPFLLKEPRGYGLSSGRLED